MQQPNQNKFEKEFRWLLRPPQALLRQQLTAFCIQVGHPHEVAEFPQVTYSFVLRDTG